MKGFWEMNVMERKNPVHTGAFLNSYDSREFTQEEVLAREGAQNALDAGKDVEGITELEFHELKISGKNKADLIKLFGFKELLSERVKEFKKNERNEFFAKNLEEFLEGDELQALLIRDKKTCGLGGAFDKYDKGDHFARLVCALNLDDKADDNSNSGGSFGLGKTAYAKSSLINTVLYHSTFERSSRSKNVGRRLMIAGVYPKHTYQNKDYGGFAYYGEKDPDEEKSAIPFEDSEAEKLWEKVLFLFDKNDINRSDTDYGTDILIFKSQVDLNQIRKASEDYYFPALIEQKVNIRFFHEDGEIKVPQPFERPDLDQFVKLMQDAKKNTQILEEKKKVSNFQKYINHELGTYAFEAAETDEASSKKNNCVAIMRGTGMIINYVPMGSATYEPAVGTFIAHEDVWRYLIASENAAHSEWNEKSRRLQQDYPDNGRKIVKSLNKRLADHFFSFQKNLQPDVASSKTESGLLSKLLSGALSGTKGDRPPDPGLPNPVAISCIKKSREERQSTWRLLVASNEHTPDDEFDLKLIPTISLAGDAKMVPIKHMDFTVSKQDGKILGRGTKFEVSLKFRKGKTIDLLLKFDDPGRKNYVVQCKFVATLRGTDE